MLKNLLIALFAFVVASQACSVTDENGVSYDLGRLSSKDFGSEDMGYSTFIRMCEPLGESKCNGLGANTCFYESETKELMFYLSKWDIAKGEPAVTAINTDQQKGVQLVFKNGEEYLALQPVVTVKLICGEGDTIKSSVNFREFSFAIDMVTPAGCPGGSSGGLSGGWLFIILLFVTVVLWLVVGVAVMVKMYGAPLAVSSAPGYPIVAMIPGLAIDGVKVTVSKLRGFAGKPATEYE